MFFFVETYLDIGLRTLSLMNSTIWDKSCVSYARALAKYSVSDSSFRHFVGPYRKPKTIILHLNFGGSNRQKCKPKTSVIFFLLIVKHQFNNFNFNSLSLLLNILVKIVFLNEIVDIFYNCFKWWWWICPHFWIYKC